MIKPAQTQSIGVLFIFFFIHSPNSNSAAHPAVHGSQRCLQVGGFGGGLFAHRFIVAHWST